MLLWALFTENSRSFPQNGIPDYLDDLGSYYNQLQNVQNNPNFAHNFPTHAQNNPNPSIPPSTQRPPFVAQPSPTSPTTSAPNFANNVLSFPGQNSNIETISFEQSEENSFGSPANSQPPFVPQPPRSGPTTTSAPNFVNNVPPLVQDQNVNIVNIDQSVPVQSAGDTSFFRNPVNTQPPRPEPTTSAPNFVNTNSPSFPVQDQGFNVIEQQTLVQPTTDSNFFSIPTSAPSPVPPVIPQPVNQDPGVATGGDTSTTDQSSCYVQTCDQTISGRQMLYERALEVVQEEEYLDAADLDIIRRHKIRVKRQTMTAGALLDYYPTQSLTEFCTTITTSTIPTVTCGAGAVLQPVCLDCTAAVGCGACAGSFTNFYTNEVITLTDINACMSYSTNQIVTLCNTPTTATVVTTTTTTTTDNILDR